VDAPTLLATELVDVAPQDRDRQFQCRILVPFGIGELMNWIARHGRPNLVKASEALNLPAVALRVVPMRTFAGSRSRRPNEACGTGFAFDWW
jgi:hypothetical protein